MEELHRWTLILVAAGKGLRFGSGGVAKQFLEVAGRSILARAIDRAIGIPQFSCVIVTVSQDAFDSTREWLQVEYGHLNRSQIRLVVGGESRQQSVSRALETIPKGTANLVFVHDAVRPLASAELYNRVASAATEFGAAVPCIPLRDTIKEVQEGFVVGTPDRSSYRLIQTPQAFRPDVLIAAHANAAQQNVQGTDDASLVELNGYRVACVDGEETNVKVTTPSDLRFVELLLTANS